MFSWRIHFSLTIVSDFRNVGKKIRFEDDVYLRLQLKREMKAERIIFGAAAVFRFRPRQQTDEHKQYNAPFADIVSEMILFTLRRHQRTTVEATLSTVDVVRAWVFLKINSKPV